jgi:hypothetical protein
MLAAEYLVPASTESLSSAANAMLEVAANVTKRTAAKLILRIEVLLSLPRPAYSMTCVYAE